MFVHRWCGGCEGWRWAMQKGAAGPSIQVRGSTCGEGLFSGLGSGSTTSRSWVLMGMMGSGSSAAVGDDTGLAEDPEPIPNLAQKLIAS